MKTYTNIKRYVHSKILFLAPVMVMGLFVTGAHGSDDQSRLKNNDTLTVIDSNKRKVGQIGPLPTGFCGGSAVSYEANGRIFSVSVNKTGFGKCQPLYFFESSDCSGTPFVQVDTSALIESARVGEPGSTVYLPKLDELRKGFQSHSLIEFESFCNTVDNIVDVAPEIPIIDLDTIFTPPFKIR
jgi:hypothetical protein